MLGFIFYLKTDYAETLWLYVKFINENVLLVHFFFDLAFIFWESRHFVFSFSVFIKFKRIEVNNRLNWQNYKDSFEILEVLLQTKFSSNFYFRLRLLLICKFSVVPLLYLQINKFSCLEPKKNGIENKKFRYITLLEFFKGSRNVFVFFIPCAVITFYSFQDE